MRIRIIGGGRTKDPHLSALQADYAERISHFTELISQDLPHARGRGGSKTESRWRQLLDKSRGSAKVLLDSRGREWTSQEFAEWLGQHALRGTREVVFLLGGPDGFSASFRKEADLLLSLSRMTLTHEWARTLLLEQIYRGFTMLRGYPYPR
ncbi:MAG TPA: 23S rRNA (pseudouridine(1915)-N(3))-methyltransferase RlmH [Terriglobia bacterium]|jgi:23S rRNA (pseudouridine1915-N3)-methyltransferase|nr:23S rRNA (pseudouridine(1915)-N(3))-methyltransferase RlmH [Terriglobia bacterium]